MPPKSLDSAFNRLCEQVDAKREKSPGALSSEVTVFPDIHRRDQPTELSAFKEGMRTTQAACEMDGEQELAILAGAVLEAMDEEIVAGEDSIQYDPDQKTFNIF